MERQLFTLLQCVIYRNKRNLIMCLWYIASADWLTKTSTTDVHVTLPPNFRQVCG